MRRTTTRFLILAVAALVGLASAQGDTAPAFRLAFVDTQALIAAHPAQADIERLGASLDAELADLTDQRDALLQTAETQELSPEQQEVLQALQVTIQSRRTNGLADIREAAAPAEAAANEIIREIAGNEAFDLVLDFDSAAGLVVFASSNVPDITEAAIALMQERYPGTDE